MTAILGFILFSGLAIMAAKCFKSALGPVVRHIKPQLEPSLLILRAEFKSLTASAPVRSSLSQRG